MRAALCGLVATVLLALAASGEAGVPEGEAALRAGDQARALREFRPAAEAGEAPAQVYLGTMYLHGVGVKRDVAEAARWFLRAAEQGDAEGQAMIGAMYFDGAGVRQDGDEALRWFRRAAEQGFAGGEWGVGAAYENGGGVERNLETALLWYRKAAARGHAAAQSRLGYFYESGQGVEANVREAAEWYRKSAEGGYSDGQAAWGWVLEHGRGVSADAKTAAAWYQKAAERGHPAALRQLGLLYEAGRGVPRNLEAAAGLFQKAAERGDAVGRFQLGRMLARGQGVAADPALAAKLFRKAADEGHVPAYLSLADVLLVGRGVDADPPQALEWLTKASDAGSRDAKFRLGLLYEAGIFAAQGNVGAAQWYRDALGSRADGAERSVFDDRIEMGLERAKTAAEWTALRARWLARGGAPLAGRRGRTFGRGEAGARIVLEALPDVANATPQAMSVEIRDAEGSRVFAANLEAGDRYLVPARSDLLLYPGRYHPNAPILQLPADDLLKYLRITVDGTPVKLEAGERLGAVRLDPDRLQSGEGVLIQRPEALLPVRRSGRILIRGIADSVIDVHDEDYVVGFIERRLAPGEQFEPPSRPDLWLLVHPRSQVEVVVDGERRLVLVPPPFREIRLRLDPDRLRSARVLPVADRRRMSGNGKDDRPAPLSLVVGADGVVGELHLQTPRGRVSMEDAVAASRLQQRGADVGEYLLQQYREQLRWHGPSSPETAEALYALAQSDLRRRDLSTALTRFHAFQRTLEELGLADDEEYAAALIGLAQAYVAIGQYQNAERLAYRVLVFADERADGRSDARLALDASYPVAGPRRTRSDEASGTGRRRADAAWLANTQRTMYRLLADLVQHRHDDVVAELFLSRTMLLDELGDPDFNLAVGPTPLLEMHAIAQRRGEDTLAQAVLHRAHWSAKVDLLLRDAPEPLTHPLDLSHTEVIGGPTAH